MNDLDYFLEQVDIATFVTIYHDMKRQRKAGDKIGKRNAKRVLRRMDRGAWREYGDVTARDLVAAVIIGTF